MQQKRRQHRREVPLRLVDRVERDADRHDLPGQPVGTIRSKIVVKGKQKFKISLVLKPLKRRPPLPLEDRSPKPPVPAPFCKKSQ